jgi:Asp-tRNA(Asn)/Glu-tRNA(Gln) amidotransferase A subunit family amidase
MRAIGAIDANRLSAQSAARAIRDGRLRASELVEACFARITLREGAVGAWSYLDFESAIRQARQADERQRSGARLGPLHGLPIGIKDVFDTADMPSEYGSASLRGRRPDHDADAVAALRASGAIIMGKTVTSEFGMYAPTGCRNPHDRTRSAGVSSAGSAAAVADHMIPLGLGTQHTASTLLPASFCGVFGFKPSAGFTSMRGSNVLVPRLANIGLLARTMDDLALFASALSGTIEAPLTPSPPRCVKWVRGPAWSRASVDARTRFGAYLKSLPVPVEELELTPDFDDAEDLTHGLLAIHIARRFGNMSEAIQENYCAPLRDLIAAGRKLGPSSAALLEENAARLAASADGLFVACDALITLSALGEATLAPEPGSGAMCMPWSLAGLPTASLALLRGSHDLPIGIQIIGRRGNDARLLSIAAWLADIGSMNERGAAV